ncbi:MAG TPA: glycosyltransferase, partial [Thermoanaerobaculia bacterium]|nr:glycosyltransferase [Thermoanaerobaculia bacterium]
MKVSLVVPAYNEERRLPATLARIGEYLRESGEAGWEIVVVDDGSSDMTADAARAAANLGSRSIAATTSRHWRVSRSAAAAVAM